MLERDVADGIHRIEDAHTNWYVVEDGQSLTIVDTGLPGSWRSLHEALAALGRAPGQIEAVLLTHGHFDHMGFARRAQQELGLEVWAHERERAVVSHPWRYEHERSRIPHLRHPRFLRIFTEMTVKGALWVKGIESLRTYREQERLDAPGRPRVVFTPGHTHGHCSLLFEERGAVIVGDAFVMSDPYTGRAGPRLVARAATADTAQAIESLDRLGELEATVALTGHGPPWKGSLREAAERARVAGAA